MFVKLVTWTVEKDNDDGLINWAGGLPEWDDAPFKAYYRKIEIEDYTGYCKEVYGPVEYAYDERTHGWEQVKVKGCKEKLPSSVHTANVPTGGATTTEGSSHTSSSGGDEALPEETGGDEDGVPALKRASWASISLILVSWVFLA